MDINENIIDFGLVVMLHNGRTENKSSHYIFNNAVYMLMYSSSSNLTTKLNVLLLLVTLCSLVGFYEHSSDTQTATCKTA
jgi:hypothetical protein